MAGGDRYEDLHYREEGHVAFVTINRPPMNPIRGKTWLELPEVLERAAANPEIGVIVLTGAGERAFSVGGDFKDQDKGSGGDWDKYTRVVRAVRDAGKPVIARVDGWAVGAGNWLAAICDFTIASDRSHFGQAGAKVGSPASGFSVSYLSHVIGEKRAREMWMMCRQYPAREMLNWGLVNAVVPPQELDGEVEKWCNEILGKAPTCIAGIKRSFNDVSEELMETGSDYAYYPPGWQDSDEAHEGSSAFQEKREPDFNRFRVKLRAVR